MELLIHSKHGSGRRYTLAAVVKTDETQTMQIGFAVCSEKDHFERKKGRMIASGRAEKRPIMIVAATDDFLSNMSLFKQIFREFPVKFKDKLVNPYA